MVVRSLSYFIATLDLFNQLNICFQTYSMLGWNNFWNISEWNSFFQNKVRLSTKKWAFKNCRSRIFRTRDPFFAARPGINLSSLKTDTVAVLAVLSQYPRYYRENEYKYYGITVVLVQNTRESRGDRDQACGTTAVMGLSLRELWTDAWTGDCVFASFSRLKSFEHFICIAVHAVE